MRSSLRIGPKSIGLGKVRLLGPIFAFQKGLRKISDSLFYPLDKRCVWQIVAPNEYKITLTFTDFHLEGNEICKYDYVQVHSGITETGTDMGKYCGKILPPPEPITSTGNNMRIVFNSDGNIAQNGFHANYAFDVDECANSNGHCMHNCINTVGSFKCTCNSGYVLQEDGKKCKEASCGRAVHVTGIHRYSEITSPGWPHKYPTKESCNWLFKTEPGHRIGVQVLEIDIEPDPRCGYDWLSFWDGGYDKKILNKLTGAEKLNSIHDDSEDDGPSKAVQMSRLCGSRIPEPDWIKSRTNVLNMKFHSDGSIVRRGFRVRYHAICGADLVASENYQNLYSHANYGDGYESSVECEWLITVPDVTKMKTIQQKNRRTQNLQLRKQQKYDKSRRIKKQEQRRRNSSNRRNLFNKRHDESRSKYKSGISGKSPHFSHAKKTNSKAKFFEDIDTENSFNFFDVDYAISPRTTEAYSYLSYEISNEYFNDEPAMKKPVNSRKDISTKPNFSVKSKASRKRRTRKKTGSRNTHNKKLVNEASTAGSHIANASFKDPPIEGMNYKSK